jgi:hypothetical protein
VSPLVVSGFGRSGWSLLFITTLTTLPFLGPPTLARSVMSLQIVLVLLALSPLLLPRLLVLIAGSHLIAPSRRRAKC